MSSRRHMQDSMYLTASNTYRMSPDANSTGVSIVSALQGGHEFTETSASIIGVITAICGNILISFALNTQRYAHMRLSQDREEREEEIRTERKKLAKHKSYRTQQDRASEEQSGGKSKTELLQPPATEAVESPSETDPLLKKTGARGSQENGDDADPEDGMPVKEKSYLRSPIWWLGISLMTVGEAGNFLAYGFAPASIVSPLGVVALISNCLIAPLFLHERFRWRDAIGVVIAIAGCVTVVLSANDTNPKLTQDAIWYLISQWEFETYFGITLFLILVLAVASNKFGEKTVLIDLGLVALFGGYTALSTKGVASLLSNTIWRVVTFPITYLLVVVLVGTAVLQIKYLNRALQRFSSTIVIPTQFVLFTISVILGSAVLYRDFERTTTEDAAKFVGGCALTFLGVWCITSGRSNGDESGGDDEEEEEADMVSLVDGQETHVQQMSESDNATGNSSAIASAIESTPSLRRVSTVGAGSLPSITLTPQIVQASEFGDDASLSKKPAALIPGNESAIHAPPLSTMEFRDQSAESRIQMHATTSTPILPTVNSSRPKTPLKRNFAGPSTPAQESTPPPSQAMELLEPDSTYKRLSRRSMAGLIPAPFTSPLSGSLSAIVADSLRRGLDHPGLPSLRGRLRRSRSSRGEASPSKAATARAAARPHRHSFASGDITFDEPGSSAVDDSVGGRMRSLSGTLAELFASTKAQASYDRQTPNK